MREPAWDRPPNEVHQIREVRKGELELLPATPRSEEIEGSWWLKKPHEWPSSISERLWPRRFSATVEHGPGCFWVPPPPTFRHACHYAGQLGLARFDCSPAAGIRWTFHAALAARAAWGDEALSTGRLKGKTALRDFTIPPRGIFTRSLTHYHRALERASSMFEAHELSPAVWMLFKLDCWSKYQPGAKKPPFLNMIFSEADIARKCGWARKEFVFYKSAWCPPSYKLLEKAHGLLARAWLGARNEKDLHAAIDLYWPEEWVDLTIARAENEGQVARESIMERIINGDWVWGPPHKTRVVE